MPRQDKQQKDRDERDDDERDDEREEDEDESDDASEEDESDEDSDEDDDAKASKADESDDDDAEPDEAAQRVAKALGVAGDDDEAKEDGEGASEDKPEEAAAAQPNRAARRREEALARRKKRATAEASGTSASDSDEDDDAGLSKDKNTRAKALLKRRREQAATAARAPAAANTLDAGEMVDDALARSAAAIGKWFRSNVQAIQWVVLIALVGAGGYVLYNSRSEKKAGEASAKLVAGIAADRGIVLDEDKRSDEEKEFDSRRVYKTTTERADAALGSFGNVIEQHKGSGAALLAKLGQGGAYLEKKEYDKAIASYAEVLASPLAAADPDVKGRATEGTAFAKEGKGDLDGALANFKELGAIDIKGYKELATYHEARVTFAKGDKAKAKELLEPLNTKLTTTTPTTEPQPLGYLKGAVSDLLTQVDPAAAAAAAMKPPTGKMPTPAELQDMVRRAQEKP